MRRPHRSTLTLHAAARTPIALGDRRREHLGALLGGLLLGATAVPATAAVHGPAGEPSERLKLTPDFASLARERDTPRKAIGSEAPATPEPPSPLALRLSLAITPKGGITPPPVAPPTPLPPPEPKEPTPAPAPQAPAAPTGRRQATNALANSVNGTPTPAAKGGSAAGGTRTEREARAPTAPAGTSAVSDATVSGNDEFLPADELEPDLPTGAPNTPARQGPTPSPATAPTQSAKRWGVAPIRWGGDVSVGWTQSRPEGGDASSSQVYQGRLRANSYLVQPYIALVATDFALTTNRSQSGGDAASNNLTGTSLTGSGSINVFPQSRFPLSASVTQSDSRTAGSFNSNNVSRRQFALRQSYRPPVGNWSTAVNYDRSQLEGDFGSDVVDRVFGDFNARLDSHSVNLATEFSRNQSENATARNFYLAGGHSTTLGDTLFWTNNASIVGQDAEFVVPLEGGGKQSNVSSVQSAQYFTFVNWIPEDSRWRGSGALRYFQNRAEVDGGAFEQRQIGGNGSMTYRVSNNLNLSAAVGINLDKNGNTSTSESLSAGYSGDPLRFGQYNYNWHSSLSGSAAQSPDGTNTQALSSSVGHSLSRSWMLDQGTNLNANLSQSAGNARSFGLGAVSSTSLTHSGGLSLSANSGQRLNGYLSASLSDSRSSGEATSAFQMATVQLSGSWQINAYSDMHSNLTWQWSRQESSSATEQLIVDEFGRLVIIDTSSQSTSTSLGGSLSYGNRRFMGVRGLRYRAEFRANTGMGRTSRRFGDPNADRPEDQVSMELGQYLMYSIGRVDAELSWRIAEIQDSRYQMIMLRAARSFGGF